MTRASFDEKMLGGAVEHHGCLLVAGLLTQSVVEALVAATDRGLASAARRRDDPEPGNYADPWYQPFPLPGAGYIDAAGRSFGLRSDNLWAADSPPAFELLERALTDSGATPTIDACLGERTHFSVGKTSLRRVPANTFGGWHQDGAFLGEHVRTLNCWVALSPCGVDAPGLDIVPVRAHGLFESGTKGAPFSWSVGPGVVEDILESRNTQVVSPEFRAGDALFFDQLLLHRTGSRPTMAKPRYAVEAWHFAASTFPVRQVPLARDLVDLAE